MHILKFIILLCFLFIMFHISNYINNTYMKKKCGLIYIPLKEDKDDKYYKSHQNIFYQGYEKDDNLKLLE